ncbi:MAG: zinc finger domain-containing protein [Nanoarchaeota archaeon]
MAEVICTSCKRKLANMRGSTQFKCPNCGKYVISRCLGCRKISARYTCAACEFSGPN